MAGIAFIGAFALVVGLWLYWHHDAPKFTTLLFLVGGLALGGWIGALLGGALNGVLGTIGTTTGQLIGFGASAVLAALALVATLEVILKGMVRRTADPQRWHPWLALALPTIIVAFGLPIMAEAVGMLTAGLGQVGDAVARVGTGG